MFGSILSLFSGHSQSSGSGHFQNTVAGLVKKVAPLVGSVAGSAAGNEVVPVIGGFIGGKLGKSAGQEVGDTLANFIRMA